MAPTSRNAGRVESAEDVDLAELLDLMWTPRGSRILHYRPATLQYAIALADRYSESSVLACPIAALALPISDESSSWTGRANLTLSASNEEAFRTLWFDRILITDAFYTVTAHELEAIQKALRLDGELIVVDWDASAGRQVGPSHKRRSTVKQACDRLASAHLAPEVIGNTHFRDRFAIRARRAGGLC